MAILGVIFISTKYENSVFSKAKNQDSLSTFSNHGLYYPNSGIRRQEY